MRHAELERVMRNVEAKQAATREGDGPNYGTYLIVFMLVFWPLSLVLSIIDYLVRDYDLQMVNLLIGLVAGGIAVLVYRNRARRSRETVVS